MLNSAHLNTIKIREKTGKKDGSFDCKHIQEECIQHSIERDIEQIDRIVQLATLNVPDEGDPPNRMRKRFGKWKGLEFKVLNHLFFYKRCQGWFY